MRRPLAQTGEKKGMPFQISTVASGRAFLRVSARVAATGKME